MDFSGSNIKKFLKFYFNSRNGNPEKISYISGNGNPKKLIVQEATFRV